jgi:hypothetical protein
MRRLREDEGARRGLTSVLMTNYKNVDIEQAREILRLLHDQDVQEVADALDVHLLSAAARFPPKPGDLLEHIRHNAAAKRRQAPKSQIVKRKVTVQMTPQLAGYFPKGLETLELTANTCQDCGDTGMARFYVNFTDEGHVSRPQRVYTAAEAFALPDPMFKHLRVSKAFCDCDMGRAMPGRGETMSKSNRQVSICPTLGEIQETSRRQRRRELQGAQ